MVVIIQRFEYQNQFKIFDTEKSQNWKAVFCSFLFEFMAFFRQTDIISSKNTPNLVIQLKGVIAPFTVAIIQRVEYQKRFRIFDTEKSPT